MDTAIGALQEAMHTYYERITEQNRELESRLGQHSGLLGGVLISCTPDTLRTELRTLGGGNSMFLILVPS